MSAFNAETDLKVLLNYLLNIWKLRSTGIVYCIFIAVIQLKKMTFTDWIGFTGVTMLLLAYFLHLRNMISKDSIAYLLLNLFGALLACLASVLLKYIPFIILEGAWTLVSVYGLIKYVSTKK